jgi:hypothetical protein
MDAIPMDKLARVYLKIRTRIQELTKDYESEVEELKAQQDEIKAAMKDQLMALGSKSVKTDQGTVILTTKTRYFTQDWDAFKTFVVEHDALDLYEKRIHQSNMAKFLEDNPSLVPPGLNSDKEFDISVRKPTK